MSNRTNSTELFGKIISVGGGSVEVDIIDGSVMRFDATPEQEKAAAAILYVETAVKVIVVLGGTS